ncbi:hypothetical protein GCM10010468_33820 [Actinocorallia longicatena]|uniref:Uncharacterized protein n=1 Tax=Actinocorallia longicatena TaxID=111803 RepID=A0ABP6QA59_9ACTN
MDLSGPAAGLVEDAMVLAIRLGGLPLALGLTGSFALIDLDREEGSLRLHPLVRDAHRDRDRDEQTRSALTSLACAQLKQAAESDALGFAGRPRRLAEMERTPPARHRPHEGTLHRRSRSRRTRTPHRHPDRSPAHR